MVEEKEGGKNSEKQQAVMAKTFKGGHIFHLAAGDDVAGTNSLKVGCVGGHLVPNTLPYENPTKIARVFYKAQAPGWTQWSASLACVRPQAAASLALHKQNQAGCGGSRHNPSPWRLCEGCFKFKTSL